MKVSDFFQFGVLYRVLLTLIIPILFLVIQLSYSKDCGPRSIRNYDPEYIYLYSGISLGKLQLNVAHIDNPGTPLQIFYALVTRTAHLVAGEDDDYFTDVLLRSDYYLKIIDISKIILISCLLFIFGMMFLIATSNVFIAIFFQCSPFLNIVSFLVFGRIVPETLSIIPILLLFYFVLKYINTKPEKLCNRQIWQFSLIAAFGLSMKLDYLPLILIPVFFLENWKGVVLYFGRLIAAFFVFAFPVLFNLRYFFKWVEKLFMHSGRYGSGDANVIDWSRFGINLKSIYTNYPVYFLIVILLIVTFGISFFIRSKNLKLISVLKGLLLCNILHILIVAKQFSLHYIVPSVFLFPLSIYVILTILIQNEHIKKGLFIILTSFFIGSTLFSYKKMMEWKVPIQNEKQIIVNETRMKVEDSPFLIIPQSYNAYFEESGLLFGWFFSGHLKESAAEILNRKLPDRYIYDSRNDAFFLWNELLSVEQVVERNSQIYVFIDKHVEEKYADVLKKFRTLMLEDCVYRNDFTGDKLYFFHKEL